MPAPETDLRAWMALAYRSALGSAEAVRIALGPGPDPGSFPPDVLEREGEDLARLEELGVRLLTIADEEYPGRLRGEDAPLLLQVAGRVSLLEEEGVEFVAGHRGAAAQRLVETLDSGGRAVVLLSKGMLKSRSLLRALHEPIEDGSVALLSAEPPRASWGPVRDQRRARLHARLSREAL